MPNWFSSRFTLVEDAIAELKKSRGYKRMMYLYAGGFLLDTAIKGFWPHIAAKIHSLPVISWLSFRTWVILGLIILLVAIIDGAQRLLEERTQKPDRPRLEGGIYDIRFNEMTPFDGIQEPRDLSVQSSLSVGIAKLPNSSDGVIGTHVILRTHFVNESSAETTIRNFCLEITTNNGDFAANYPEDGEILQSGFGQRPETAKRFTNLNELIKTGHTVTYGKHIEGHLHFIVRGLILRNTSLISPRVLVIDAWGGEHPLPYKLSRHSVPPPSERLLILPPTDVEWVRPSVTPAESTHDS